MQKHQLRLARPYPLPAANSNEPDKWNRPLFSLFECLDVSQELLDSYWQRHTLPLMGVGPTQAEALSQLAVARLESLLTQGRKELSGQFTAIEMSVLMTSYMDQFVAPADCDELADVVASNLGIGDRYTTRESLALVERLRALTALQRTALFDALELVYFSDKEPLEVLRELNIELALSP